MSPLVSSSPLRLRHEAWQKEHQTLTSFLDSQPTFRVALSALRDYHKLTDYLNEDLADFEPYRVWSPDGRFYLQGFAIERRTQRFNVRKRKAPPAGLQPPFNACPLAIDNVFWQQSGKQFPYRRSINGTVYNWLVQLQSFGRDHFTIASANPEPQDWRPSLTRLHQRLLDAHAIALQLGCLVLVNGDGAGDSIPDWYHLHGLRTPDGEVLPVQRAAAVASGAPGPVLRLDEPHWPLPAFRITGSAQTIAAEVTRLAERCTEIAGTRATESIAMYVEGESVVCIYVPRDRGREASDAFGGKLGAFEVATGSFVFSDPDRCAQLRANRIPFPEMWAILGEVRPEWSHAL